MTALHRFATHAEPTKGVDGHSTIRVYANGTSAGLVTMTNEEAAAFRAYLLDGPRLLAALSACLPYVSGCIERDARAAIAAAGIA